MATTKRRRALHAVRVRVREIPYTRLGENALGDPHLFHETAYGPGNPSLDPDLFPDMDEDEAHLNYKLGQLLDLNDEDYLRLKAAGAVVDADDVQTLGEDDAVELLDVRTASVEDLSDWIKQDGPNINDVVQASEGEPDLAQKLLEAENKASDGDPRKSVVDGLTAVIARG